MFGLLRIPLGVPSQGGEAGILIMDCRNKDMQVMIMAGLVLPVDAQRTNDQVLEREPGGGGVEGGVMELVSRGECWVGLAQLGGGRQLSLER